MEEYKNKHENINNVKNNNDNDKNKTEDKVNNNEKDEKKNISPTNIFKTFKTKILEDIVNDVEEPIRKKSSNMRSSIDIKHNKNSRKSVDFGKSLKNKDSTQDEDDILGFDFKFDEKLSKS